MATTQTDDESSTVAESSDDVSRDPADYTPTDHFVIRARRSYGPITETRTDPPITADVIERCISEGETKRVRDGCVKFIDEVDGEEWHLVTHGRKVLTAYAPAEHEPEHHVSAAVGGDR